MNPNKLLVTITDLNQLEICKKARITNFLFPLKDFCVGFPTVFSIDEIQEEAYLYINRILDTQSYEKLKQVLMKVKNNIKGIVFEDFGVITLAKELDLKQELILYQTHFGTNHQSINENLEFVDSMVISTDITKKEIDQILEKTKKPLVYVLYSLIPAMYSRRTLLTNFETEFATEKKDIVKLEEQISKKDFLAVENEYGTVLYHDKYLNGLDTYDDDKIKFYFINPLFLSKEQFQKVLNDLMTGNKRMEANEDRGFLDQETIYRLKEVKNEKN